MQRVFALSAALILTAAPAAAESTRAKQAILVEHPSGRVLLEKAADKAMAPSSMTKLMTLYLAFEALKEGRVGEAAAITISKRAAGARGASMDLSAGDSVPFGELVRGAAIASANDAAVAIAEHLGKSESAFAKTMTATARDLGLAGSRFANATGHTAKDHRMTAADVAKLEGDHLSRALPHLRREFRSQPQSAVGRLCGHDLGRRLCIAASATAAASASSWSPSAEATVQSAFTQRRRGRAARALPPASRCLSRSHLGMSELGEERSEEVVVPSSAFELAAHGAFRGFELGEVEGEAPEECEIARPVVLAIARLILVEDDVEHPMELVLDGPVAADGVEALRRKGAG